MSSINTPNVKPQADQLDTRAGALEGRADTLEGRTTHVQKFVSVAALVAATATGDVAVGEVAETIAYRDGWAATVKVPVGGNHYELIDAGSAGARPAENGGSVIHVAGGSGGLYLKGLFMSGPVNPFQFGAYGDNSNDDTTAMQNAFDFADRVHICAGIYLVDPVVGLVVSERLTITGDGKYASLFNTSSTAAGSVFKRDFNPVGPNDYLTAVSIRDVGVVLNHVAVAAPTNQKQIAFDFRNITRSTIQDCYAGNYSVGALVGVRSDPSSQANARQGYGIVFGSVGSSDPAYAGGEVNRALNNIVHGCQKCIVLDDLVLSPVSAAHGCIVKNNDVQIAESGIVQESRYTAGCEIHDNTVQSIGKMTGSSATTYAYRIEGYNNTLGGGYTECTAASTDFLVKLGSLSTRNTVRPFLYTEAAHVLSDDGTDNLLEHIDPDKGLQQEFGGFERFLAGAAAWVVFDSVGAILKAHNVNSVANNAAGDWSLSLPAGLIDGDDFPVIGGGIVNASASPGVVTGRTQSATSVRVVTYNISNSAYEDWDKTWVVIWGA